MMPTIHNYDANKIVQIKHDLQRNKDILEVSVFSEKHFGLYHVYLGMKVQKGNAIVLENKLVTKFSSQYYTEMFEDALISELKN